MRRRLLQAFFIIGLLALAPDGGAIDPSRASGQVQVRSTHSISSLAVTSQGRTTALVTLAVSGEGDYYVRFAPTGTMDWSDAVTLTLDAGNGSSELTHTITTGLVPNASYVVQAGVETTFPQGTSVSTTFTNRPAHLDFEIDGSGGFQAHGIAANASTIWVASDGPAGSERANAYMRTPATDYGTLDTTKRIDLATHGISNAKGAWTDGSHLYVVNSPTRVHALSLEGGALDASKGFRITDAVVPWGIWANADTFWVASSDDPERLLVAFHRSGSRYGERDSAKDIRYESSLPRGLWSNGTTLWVLTQTNKKLSAYLLDTGTRLPTLDIDLGDLSHPLGVWGDGDTLWVTNNAPGAPEVLGYYRPIAEPLVARVSLQDASSATSATVRVLVPFLEDGHSEMVHLRHRSALADTWTTATAKAAAGTVDFSLSGLTANATLVVQASLESAFPAASTVTGEFALRPLGKDIPLTEGGTVRGLWADDDTLWAVSAAAGRVHAYDLDTKAHDASKSFALDSANSDPRGAYGSSSTLWVLDGNGTVYAYTITAGSSFGDSDTAKTFDSTLGSARPEGLASNGTSLWVAEHMHQHVHAYNVSTMGTFGARQEALEGALATPYGAPRGMWTDGSTLWVVDGSFLRVHAHGLGSSGVGGVRLSREIELDGGNQAPGGIAGSGGVLWVADTEQGTAYAYFIPAAPSGDITGVSLGGLGRTTAELTVSFANPDSSELAVGLKYRTAGRDAVTTSTTSSGTDATFSLTGLSAGRLYDLQVSLGTTTTLVTPPFRALTEGQQRGQFLRESIVEVYEDDHAWLRAAYDFLRKQDWEIEPTSGGAGHVVTGCRPQSLGFDECVLAGIGIARPASTSIRTYIHELAHIWTLVTALNDEDSGPLGMGWLYFHQLASGGNNCDVSELYADALVWSVAPSMSLYTYYALCSVTPSVPGADTQALIRSISAGDVPAWLATQFSADDLPYQTSSDDRYAHDYDLEALLGAARPLRSQNRSAAMNALGYAFGGYCNEELAYRAAVRGRTATRNPWRAGGCVPHAVESIVFSSSGLLTWEAPPYDGGEEVTDYEVQWRGPGEEWGEEFSGPRSATVPAAGVPAYEVRGAPADATARVRAVNANGAGDSDEASQEPGRPAAPLNVRLRGEPEELVVTWDAGPDGGYAITSYDLRYIAETADRSDPANWIELAEVWTSGALTYTITGLENRRGYFVQLRARNSAGESLWSDEQLGGTGSSDATLSELALSDVVLQPAFVSTVESYTASVAHEIAQVTVSATATHPRARVGLPGDDDRGTPGTQVALDVGANVVSVTVTAENRVTTRTYTVTVTRAREDATQEPPSAPVVLLPPVDAAALGCLPGQFVHSQVTSTGGILFTCEWTVAALSRHCASATLDLSTSLRTNDNDEYVDGFGNPYSERQLASLREPLSLVYDQHGQAYCGTRSVYDSTASRGHSVPVVFEDGSQGSLGALLRGHYGGRPTPSVFGTTRSDRVRLRAIVGEPLGDQFRCAWYATDPFDGEAGDALLGTALAITIPETFTNGGRTYEHRSGMVYGRCTADGVTLRVVAGREDHADPSLRPALLPSQSE